MQGTPTYLIENIRDALSLEHPCNHLYYLYYSAHCSRVEAIFSHITTFVRTTCALQATST